MFLPDIKHQIFPFGNKNENYKEQSAGLRIKKGCPRPVPETSLYSCKDIVLVLFGLCIYQ